MIYAFTGLGGSSKTYNMVKWARWYWKQGINIYSNTKLLYSKYGIDEERKGTNIIDHPKDFSYFERLVEKLSSVVLSNARKNKRGIKSRGKIIYFDTVEEIQNAKDGIVLFDEGQVLFNSGAWKEISDEFKYKVSQERKHDLDFFTTTRRFRSILIDYRQEVHRWFHCEELLAIKYGKKNKKKILIGLFSVSEKDMEAIDENLPDKQNPSIKRKFLFIHRWSKRLYDTKYDIGFKPIKLIRTNVFDDYKKIWKKSYLIIPRNKTLKDALNAISMMSRTLSPMRSKTSSVRMKN